MGFLDLLRNGTIEFNKYRAPEIIAEIISFDKESFKIEFEGSFCYTCGFYDYFDDYKILLEDDYDVKTEIVEILEIKEGAVVTFKLNQEINQFFSEI